MPRYWVIAPYNAEKAERWEKVWKYDKEPEPRLTYALQMTKNVSVKYYRVDFKLQDQP